MSLLGFFSTYMTYVNVPFHLILIPWILANMLSTCGSDSSNNGGNPGQENRSYINSTLINRGFILLLPWPQRYISLLLAFPLVPSGFTCMFAVIKELVKMNTFFYLFPMGTMHIMAAVLQTMSLMVAGSLLTKSIRDKGQNC
jgi:hypothetical protein